MQDLGTRTSRSTRRRGMSLRLLMAVVLLVGGGMGWFAHRARVQRLAVAAIDAAGAEAVYRWQREGGFAARPPGPNWLQKVLGPDYLSDVVTVHGGARSGCFGGYISDGKADDALLASVGRLNRVEILNLANCPGVTDAGLPHLRGLTHLQFLNLENTGVRGAGLAHLAGLVRLETLALGTIRPTDSDLVPLARMAALKDLAFSGENLTDAGLAHLSGLTRLESLAIYGPRGKPSDGGPSKSHSAITNRGLEHLRGLVRLRSLSMDASRIESIEPLSRLGSLEGLILNESCVNDDGLRAVAEMRGLKSLNLAATTVGDAGLEHLAGLPNLESLDLDRTRVTDAGLVHLARLPRLRSLSLIETAVSDAGLKHLGNLVGLDTLYLDSTRITDKGLADLARLKATIRIQGTAVTPGGVAAMAARAPEPTFVP